MWFVETVIRNGVWTVGRIGWVGIKVDWSGLQKSAADDLLANPPPPLTHSSQDSLENTNLKYWREILSPRKQTLILVPIKSNFEIEENIQKLNEKYNFQNQSMDIPVPTIL